MVRIKSIARTMITHHKQPLLLGEKLSLDQCSSDCATPIITAVKSAGKSFACTEVTPTKKVGYFQSTLSPPEAISRATILERALVWLKSRIRYSQLRSHSEPSIDDGLGYRTDCSGFVGMSWKILSFSTSWARSQLKAKSTTIFSGIPCKDLLPGDAMVNGGHIVLFRKWISKSEGTFVAWEEGGTNSGTVEKHRKLLNLNGETGTEGCDVQGSSSKYQCMRRSNLKE